MQVLRPRQGLTELLQGLQESARSRVFLFDYDGTLAPFRVERDQALPYPGVREALAALIAMPRTRVAIVSGRAAGELPALLGLPQLPELWGSHGAERIVNGKHHLLPVPPAVREGLDLAAAAVEAAGASALCETKPAGLALHWRGRTDEEVEATAPVISAWRELAPEHALDVRAFDGGVELRMTGVDKGAVVRSILADSEPDSLRVYLGDDLTDEDAFGAIAATGVSILVRPELRSTAADAWVVPPTELLELLKTWTRGGRDVA
jgi:trehalose 6-phosphate phosphatase